MKNQIKDKKGIFYYEYELLDQPLPQEAPLDNATLAKSPPAEPVCINNTLINKPLINKIIIKQQEQEEEEARQEEILKPLEATAVVSRLNQAIRDTYLKVFNQYYNVALQ